MAVRRTVPYHSSHELRAPDTALAWVLVAAGMGLLALSFLLEPAPTTYVLIHKQRVPVTHDNAVDYVIGFCRLAGVVLVIAGAYLGYRRLRPDAVVVDDGLPPSATTST